jgi:hypothetical protein
LRHVFDQLKTVNEFYPKGLRYNHPQRQHRKEGDTGTYAIDHCTQNTHSNMRIPGSVKSKNFEIEDGSRLVEAQRFSPLLSQMPISTLQERQTRYEKLLQFSLRYGSQPAQFHITTVLLNALGLNLSVYLSVQTSGQTSPPRPPRGGRKLTKRKQNCGMLFERTTQTKTQTNSFASNSASTSKHSSVSVAARSYSLPKRLLVKTFLFELDPRRAYTRNEWLGVGLMIAEIFSWDEEGMTLFDAWSQTKLPKHKENPKYKGLQDCRETYLSRKEQFSLTNQYLMFRRILDQDQLKLTGIGFRLPHTPSYRDLDKFGISYTECH